MTPASGSFCAKWHKCLNVAVSNATGEVYKGLFVRFRCRIKIESSKETDNYNTLLIQIINVCVGSPVGSRPSYSTSCHKTKVRELVCVETGYVIVKLQEQVVKRGPHTKEKYNRGPVRLANEWKWSAQSIFHLEEAPRLWWGQIHLHPECSHGIWEATLCVSVSEICWRWK